LVIAPSKVLSPGRRPSLRRGARRPARLLGTALSLALGTLVFGAPQAAEALCALQTDPDCVARRVALTGTIDFFATGASFTANDDADDRPDRTLEVAEVTVPTTRVPARATLSKAYLYFGGSLFLGDADGIDVPDTEVELQLPGSDTFATVRGEQTYRSGAIPGFPEVVLYTVRADITELMKSARAPMVGTYRVRGFAADVFDGEAEHTAANASFSIILVFEEPRLPPRTIALFDGLQEVLGSTLTLDLSGFTVSQVPSGQLTFYAEEGDCNPGPGDCDRGNNLSGYERIRVIGADPARTLVLGDPINASNDLFNRTINTVDPPLRDVPGTDIDTFDITPVLRAGDDTLTVEVTTPLPNAEKGTSGELIGLVYVIVGIDVFAPELRVDSRIDVSTARGETLDAYFPGDPLRVAFEVSNTGNLPATEVELSTELPANVTRYEIANVPEGATLEDDPAGGANRKGRIVVKDISVRHGEVSSLVLLVETTCPLSQDGTLATVANLSAAREGGVPFAITSSVALLARDRCGPRFFLFGGGGCQHVAPASPTVLWALLPLGALLVLAALARARRPRPAPVRARRTRLGRGAPLVVLALALGDGGCGGDDPQPDRPAPVPIGTACPGHDDMVVIPALHGVGTFCVDRFEASIESGTLGNATQPEGGDGSTTAVAASKRFTLPARGVTWFQASAACRNANKRLCSADEWASACGGTNDATYPYGDTYAPSTCNGFDAIRADVVETGAMIIGRVGPSGVNEAEGCVSEHGAYDMSGNVWEWNDTPYFERTRRGLVGGSFRSNRIGLRCLVQDNHAAPDEANDAFGFRCCLDVP
jgi:hypothetical protein